jgi:hypothetical protein
MRHIRRLRNEALREYLARSGATQPADDAVERMLLQNPFNDARADRRLSVDVDHHLYGARRRSHPRR